MSVLTQCNLLFEGCYQVKCFDLSGMSNGISRIEKRFLSGFRGLKTVNLTPFTGRISGTLPEWFLNDCAGLKSLDLSPLSLITVISEGFLSGCTGLTSLDFTPMCNVTALPEWFLEGLTGLTAINFSGFKNGVTELPIGFLGNCSSLETLDFSGLGGVAEMPMGFLKGCSSLIVVTSPPPCCSKAPAGWDVVEAEAGITWVRRTSC